MHAPFIPRPAIALADAALVALAERHAKLRDARARFVESADPEALHDVRVAVRRLRAARRLFDPDLDLPGRLSDTSLRKLGRRLAPLRDVDILRGAVRTGAARFGPRAFAVVERLERRRDRLATQARERMGGGRMQRVLDALGEWVVAPAFRVEPDATVQGRLAPRLAADVVALLEEEPWELELEQDRKGALREKGRKRDAERISELLHRLRRRGKRVRYQLEILAPFLGWDERAAVESLVELQDVLGELQDVRVIEAWAAALKPDERPNEEFDEWLVGRRQAALGRWRAMQAARLAPLTDLLAGSPA